MNCGEFTSALSVDGKEDGWGGTRALHAIQALIILSCHGSSKAKHAPLLALMPARPPAL